MRTILWVFCGVVGWAACGFETNTNPGDSDGGSHPDLTGLDLLGVDLTSPPGFDLAMGGGGTGPGPLGALPAGFCCTGNEQCRNRLCMAIGGGPSYCADDCRSDTGCDAWGAFRCDTNNSYCVPAAATYDCLPQAQYTYGTKPTGACCQAGFDKAGQECAGGLCYAQGPDSNPFFCTQGCDSNAPCPPGHFCNIDHWCSKLDLNGTYTCQP
jgi:hypothetical protein